MIRSHLYATTGLTQMLQKTPQGRHPHLADRVVAVLEDVLDELGRLLEKHIRKEERELFVEIEKVLTDEELNTISEKIGKSRE